MKKVLILEDDELIAELERDYLEMSNYEVETEENGKVGLDKIMKNQYDLIIMDVMMPGMSGFEVCKKVRETKDIPIIMVTAKKEDFDIIRGLGLGADDYIVKPFSPAELVARVKAHINIHEKLLSRAVNNSSVNEIVNKEMQINTDSRRVIVRGLEITLTNKEYDLLEFLAQNPDKVFSKEVLFDKVWGFDAVGDMSTVTVHVNRLREKIEKDMSDPEYIETVWGVGYRFKK